VGYDSGFYAMYGTLPTPFQPKKSVQTDDKGEFKLTDNFDGAEPTLVFVDDIDGEENGLFESVQLEADFSKATQTGKPKGWYEGEYTFTMDVELTEVETEEQ
jgi:putative lipoprotein (rSAM/lipoprotein system)